MLNNKNTLALVKLVVFIALLVPAIQLTYGLFTQTLGTNPVEKLTHETGKWGLICLILSLCITPLVCVFKLKFLMRFRRMLGLYAFFYVCLHFLIYWVFDQSLSFKYVWEDIRDRPYITLGFSAWLILVPLAITSTKNWRKKLGKNWIKLHKLVYAAALLGLFHYIWLIRADYSEVVIYAVMLLGLLGYRMLHAFKFT